MKKLEDWLNDLHDARCQFSQTSCFVFTLCYELSFLFLIFSFLLFPQMSVDMDADYFENIPDEVVRRIFSFLPGEDRLNLQLLGNQRIRSLAISVIIDSRSFHSLKIESDVMMLLGYSNLRKIYFPPSLKVTEEWFMSFGRKPSVIVYFKVTLVAPSHHNTRSRLG